MSTATLYTSTRMMAINILYKTATFMAVLLSSAYGEEEMTGDQILNAEMKLRKSLLQDYDKTSIPSRNTTVMLSQLAIQNLKVFESDHEIDVFAQLTLVWDDPRLKWNLSEHEDVGFLSMDPEQIWTPDLAIYNAASGSHVPRSPLPMIVYPTHGTILYTSPYNLRFSCIMDLTYWPHDSHNCTMKLGSWVHQGHMLDLLLKDNKLEIQIPSEMRSSGQNLSKVDWGIIHTSVSKEETIYPCCQEPVVTVLMTMEVMRNAPVYSWTVKIPVACLSVLTLILFLLPPTAGEKLTFGGLCLVMNLIYIAYTSHVISLAPSHTPLIIRFVSQQVVLLTVCLVASCVIIRLARDPRSTGVPSWLKRLMVAASYPLCLKGYRNLLTYTSHTYEFKSEEMDLGEGDINDNLRRLNMDGCEWIFLAAVLDRLALFLYTLICIISLVRFSCVF